MSVLRPRTLSLITTHHCTAACDHCCFHCTPKITKRIPPDRLEALINEAACLPGLELVVFTGGECFTIPELDDRIAQARRVGLLTRCVSNGYWGFTPERARERATRLKAAGLNELNLSTGQFHARYVPVRRIVNAARAATDAGILTLITVESFEGEGELAQSFFDDPAIGDDIRAGRILFQRNVWMDNSGTTPLTHKPDVSRFVPERMLGCGTVMDVMAVTPDLSAVACCGLHLEKIPELHIGSVRERSLVQVVEGAEADFMQIWLKVAGPERIYAFARSKDPDITLPTHSVHPCQTCLSLYSDPRVMAAIRAHFREVEDEVVRVYSAEVVVRQLNRVLASRAPVPA